MMLVYTALFGIAYMPTSIFGSYPNCLESALNLRQAQGTGQSNFCTGFLLLLLIFWPALTLIFLVVSGFDPYSELSEKELK